MRYCALLPFVQDAVNVNSPPFMLALRVFVRPLQIRPRLRPWLGLPIPLAALEALPQASLPQVIHQPLHLGVVRPPMNIEGAGVVRVLDLGHGFSWKGVCYPPCRNPKTKAVSGVSGYFRIIYLADTLLNLGILIHY